jgi:CRISPR system Cascade subunit CasE
MDEHTDRCDRPPPAAIVHEPGAEGLAAKAERRGFEIESVHADGYLQHRLYKPGTDRPISMSALEFNGVLRVVNVERFLETLHRRIGPAKASAAARCRCGGFREGEPLIGHR